MNTPISDDLVDKLAALSLLEFNAEEKKAIQQDLTNVVAFYEQIAACKIPQMKAQVADILPQSRPDIPAQSLNKKVALSSAKNTSDDYFLVPKVIQK